MGTENPVIPGNSAECDWNFEGGNDDSDLFQLLSTRQNSYFARTAARQRSSQHVASNAEVFILDFLDILTAAAELYHQDAVLPMQQLDGLEKLDIGFGAVFQVTSVGADHISLSRLLADGVSTSDVPVILKRSPLELFEDNGIPPDDKDVQNGAASFLMELRVLSHPPLRNHPNVVSMKGYPSLPFETKNYICQDVAKGILALHKSGVVHGDVKPQNVLMFEDNRWTAKVADFSHAIIVTGHAQQLLGGTLTYSPPEWNMQLSPTGLKKTDIYSYGLVFGSVMAGTDVIRHFLDQKENGRAMMDRIRNLKLKKSNGTIKDYIADLIYHADNTDLISRREDIAKIDLLLSTLLAVDPDKRDLELVLATLAEMLSENQGSSNNSAIFDNEDCCLNQYDHNMIVIPYAALHTMSRVLKEGVMKALMTAASDEHARRHAAACFELCKCYASGFGVDGDFENAYYWLIRACESGDLTARGTVHRLSAAFGRTEEIRDIPIDEWLFEAATKGSLIALEDLHARESLSILQAADIFRDRFIYKADQFGTELTTNIKGLSDFLHTSSNWSTVLDEQGNTILHWAATKGQEDILHGVGKGKQPSVQPSVLNHKNNFGDTPLLCACRMGHYHFAKSLLELGADASIPNFAGENVLHFLSTFEITDIGINPLAISFCKAGADLEQEAWTSSLHDTVFDLVPMIPGCAMTRAVNLNKPLVLTALLIAQDSLSLCPSDRELRYRRARLGRLFAWSCHMNHVAMLQILIEKRGAILTPDFIKDLSVWVNLRRCSIPALAISGLTTSDQSATPGYPERFLRCLIHGAAYLENLRHTIELLRKLGVDFSDSQCRGVRNALFFAIREGRADAVTILLENEDNGNPLEPFGTIEYLQEMVNSDLDCSLKLSDTLPNHRLKAGLISAVSSAIEFGFHDIFRALLQTRNGEALNAGPECLIVCDWSTNDGLSQEALEVLKDASVYFPRDLTTMHMQTRSIYSDREAMRVRVYFYERTWFTRLLEGQMRKYCLYSGRLNFSLLYLTLIAQSSHRDITFAHTLLEELKLRGVRDYNKWVPSSPLEQLCYEQFSSPPLQFAAANGWDDLANLLCSKGADISAETYYLDWSWDVRRFALTHIPWWPRLWDYHDTSTLRPKKRQLLSCLLKSIGTEAMKNEELALEGVCRLLRYEDQLTPVTQAAMPTRMELDEFISLKRRITSKEGKVIAAEIWKLLAIRHSNPTYPRDPKLVIDAVETHNYDALKCLLDIGYSPNGTWSEFLTSTPLDLVLDLLRQQSQESEALEASDDIRTEYEACRELLLSKGARRSLFGSFLHILEVQIILTLVSYALFTAPLILYILYARSLFTRGYYWIRDITCFPLPPENERPGMLRLFIVMYLKMCLPYFLGAFWLLWFGACFLCIIIPVWTFVTTKIDRIYVALLPGITLAASGADGNDINVAIQNLSGPTIYVYRRVSSHINNIIQYYEEEGDSSDSIPLAMNSSSMQAGPVTALSSGAAAGDDQRHRQEQERRSSSSEVENGLDIGVTRKGKSRKEIKMKTTITKLTATILGKMKSRISQASGMMNSFDPGNGRRQVEFLEEGENAEDIALLLDHED